MLLAARDQEFAGELRNETFARLNRKDSLINSENGNSVQFPHAFKSGISKLAEY
jgi:hypothetical protein